MRQQQEWMQQQQLQEAQQAAQLQAAQQEKWARQQQLLAFQQQQQQQQQFLNPSPGLMAQPTGFGYAIFPWLRTRLLTCVFHSSNNPFAPSPSGQPFSLSTSALPSLSQSSTSSPAPQSAGPSFNLQGTYANGNGPSPPPPSQSAPPRQGSAQVKTRADEQHSHLANLFANRTEDGIDTFGNFGQLRCVTCSFVLTAPRPLCCHDSNFDACCRYGQQAGRLVGQQTGQPQAGHNPFAQQQQQNGEQPFFSI